MNLAPEAVSDHDPELKHPESVVAKESASPDISTALGGYLGAWGSDGSSPPNSNPLSNPVMRHPASGEMRVIALRRAQQGLGNHKIQQKVAQLRPLSVVQRQCSCGGTCASCQGKTIEGSEETRVVQRQTTTASAGENPTGGDIVPTDSAGQPLDSGTREFMENRFGSDFADVRVHTDERAAASAEALQAEAYTSGRDIYFAAGKYAPESEDGQHLIAHELTHTVQQASVATSMAMSHAGGVIVGDERDPLEAEAENVADTVVNGQSGTPEVSKDSTPTVRRDARSTAAAVWSATGGRVASAAGELWDEAKETAAAFIDRIAPGVLPLLRNAGTFIYEKITAGIDNLFSGIASRVEKQGVVGAITGILGEIAGSIGKSVGQLAAGSCSAIVEAASSIVQFVKDIAGEAFTELGRIAGKVGDFFSEIWKDFGAPALDAVKKVAGEAWKWITDKAGWLWDKLLPIRKAAGAAWSWIKNQFNIAKDEAAGLLDRFYDWAKEQWMKVRDKIEPILGPLKLVAGALLLLSPLGPIIAIWKGAPYLWKALQWIWANGIKPASEKIRAEFREHILPQILDGVDAITAKLDEASAFLCGHAGTISAGLHSLEDALGGISFLKFASRMVGVVRGFFDSLAAKGKCKFSDVIAEVKAVLLRVYQFVKPVLEVLRQAALIALFGPWAILDDGVWKTLNDILAFAKKTPCIREIAGLLHVDGAMAKVGEIRAVLKDIWQVMSDQKRFEAEIHKRLDGMLMQIPSQVETVVGTIAGLDGPHLDTLAKRFIAPKLAEVVSKAPQLLIDMAWGLVWPWPGVIKDYQEIEKQVDKLKTSLWDFEFSKAIDAGLAIWRRVNGIVGLLYGWFFLAAVIIGAIFASPQAGAAVAYEVGEILLVSTLIAEALSIEKAKANLMSRSRLAKAEKERENEDKEDYEVISGSVINLAVMGALAVLGEIAVDFAKAVFAEIKGIFLPKGVEPPKIEIPTKAAEPARVGEPPKVREPVSKEAPKEPGEIRAEPTEKPPSDAVAKAEEKGVPREQFEAEVGKLREKAANRDNVRQPKDQRFDAEMDAEGHTFDRNKSDKTWCRFTDPSCGLDLGGDLNSKVDAALKEKAVPKVQDEPPVAEPTPLEGAEELPGTKPVETPKPADSLPPDQVRRYERYARQQRAKGKDPLSPEQWYEKIGQKPPRNPYGKTGDPAHVTEVARLAEKARAEFPDDIIHQGDSIEGRTGIRRQPDVWVEDAETGAVKKVYEAARTNPDGTFVPREVAKKTQYDSAGIPNEFGDAGPVKK
jgi:Domain of unknown function (DUF4157)